MLPTMRVYLSVTHCYLKIEFVDFEAFDAVFTLLTVSNQPRSRGPSCNRKTSQQKGGRQIELAAMATTGVPPINSEEMSKKKKINSEEDAAEVDKALKNLPTDAFVETLLRLPPRSRHRPVPPRLPALACRHRRANAAEPGQAARALRQRDEKLRVRHRRPRGRAVQGGVEAPSRHRQTGRHVQRSAVPVRRQRDHPDQPGVTGESLAVPPCPEYVIRSGTWTKFSFGFHLATGRYKIVHLPHTGGFDELQVLTLGDAAWRRELLLPRRRPRQRRWVHVLGGLGRCRWKSDEDTGAT